MSLAEVTTFGKYLGGSPANVAVAAARLGHSAAIITRTGADPFGEFVHQALRGYGVDDCFVTPVPGLPTPVTFCEIFPPDNFPLYFYRFPKAPDLEIYADELDYPAIRCGPGVLGDRDRPVRAAEPGGHTGRAGQPGPGAPDGPGPGLPAYVLAVGRAGQAAGPGRRSRLSTVIVGNLDECEVAVGSQGPGQDRGGACWTWAPSWRSSSSARPACWPGTGGGRGRGAAGHAITVVNGLGAGDSFGGALCHGLLAGWDLEPMIRFANAAGAIVASRIACSDAMPTAAEVDALLSEDAHAQECPCRERAGRMIHMQDELRHRLTEARAHAPEAVAAAAAARPKRRAAGRRVRPADDHRGGPHRSRHPVGRRQPDGDGQPVRVARPADDRAGPARRRRRAGHRRHHRGPDAARRAGRQGRRRLDEPRRDTGRRRSRWTTGSPGTPPRASSPPGSTPASC